VAAQEHPNSLLSIRHLNSHARWAMIYELFAAQGPDAPAEEIIAPQPWFA
jgi:hypothetical protein